MELDPYGIQKQIDRLDHELRAAQFTIQKLKKDNRLRLIGLSIFAVSISVIVGPSATQAISRSASKTTAAPSTSEKTTQFKAPFEVVDDQGHVIMRVRDD